MFQLNGETRSRPFNILSTQGINGLPNNSIIRIIDSYSSLPLYLQRSLPRAFLTLLRPRGLLQYYLNASRAFQSNQNIVSPESDEEIFNRLLQEVDYESGASTSHGARKKVTLNSRERYSPYPLRSRTQQSQNPKPCSAVIKREELMVAIKIAKEMCNRHLGVPEINFDGDERTEEPRQSGSLSPPCPPLSNPNSSCSVVVPRMEITEEMKKNFCSAFGHATSSSEQRNQFLGLPRPISHTDLSNSEMFSSLSPLQPIRGGYKHHCRAPFCKLTFVG